MARLNFGTEILEEEKTKDFSSNFKFLPENLKRTYGVVLVFRNEKEEKFQVHYEIDVICLEQLNDRDYKFELFKKQVYINEKAPDSIIDVLAERCGNVLYPLQVKINSVGKAISILNHNEIQERWIKEKKSIKQSYKGNPYDRIVENMEQLINNPKKTETLFLKRDWFMKLFFAPIYSFNNLSATHQDIELPFIPYAAPVKFNIKQLASKHSTRDGVTVINRKGKCIDNRGEKDILRGNIISSTKDKKNTEGLVDLEYLIYKNSPIVDAITGVCTIDFASGNKKQVAVEIYNLKEKTPKSSIEKKQEALAEEEQSQQPKKRKKRFSIFGNR